MTRDDLLIYPSNTPVRLIDGALGLLIRFGRTDAGIQVPGEADIRWVALDRLVDLGGGALAEATT